MSNEENSSTAKGTQASKPSDDNKNFQVTKNEKGKLEGIQLDVSGDLYGDETIKDFGPNQVGKKANFKR